MVPVLYFYCNITSTALPLNELLNRTASLIINLELKKPLINQERIYKKDIWDISTSPPLTVGAVATYARTGGMFLRALLSPFPLSPLVCTGADLYCVCVCVCPHNQSCRMSIPACLNNSPTLFPSLSTPPLSLSPVLPSLSLLFSSPHPLSPSS